MPALGNSRWALHPVTLCTPREHLLLAVFSVFAEADLTVMYCKYIPCVTIKFQVRCCAPFLSHGRKNNSWRNTARGRPLSQGVPSSKTVHWTVFEFTPCRGISQACFACFASDQGLCPMDPAAFEKAGETFLLWNFTDSGYTMTLQIIIFYLVVFYSFYYYFKCKA